MPFKGAVLNQVSRWWFETTKDLAANHVRASPLPDVLVAARCQAFPVEFVVRGYITGSTSTSLWTHYKNGERKYCGIDFPRAGQKSKIGENVCTPTTKDAEHDEPISGEDIVSSGRMTQAQWDECRGALAIFATKDRGVARFGARDTKFEFAGRGRPAFHRRGPHADSSRGGSGTPPAGTGEHRQGVPAAVVRAKRPTAGASRGARITGTCRVQASAAVDRPRILDARASRWKVKTKLAWTHRLARQP